MSDFNQPTTSSDYLTGVLPQLKARDVDAITLCLVDPTNIVTGTIKYVRASSKFQEYNGSAFVDFQLSIAGGGTGANTAANARTNLGLGSMATQNNNAVTILGGTIGNVVSIDASRLADFGAGKAPQSALGSGSGGAGTKFLADDQTYKTPSTVPTGTIAAWLTGTPPTGWIALQGGNVSRTTYSDLFALWGTTFGAGDGSTTFGLPNLQQRFLMGRASSGTGSGAVGSTGGAIDQSVTFPNNGWTGFTSIGDVSDRILSHLGQPDTDGDFSTVAYLSSDRTLASGMNPPFVVVIWIVKT